MFNNTTSGVSTIEEVSQTGETVTIKLSSLPNGDYATKSFEAKLGSKIRIEGDPETLVGSMGKVIVDGYKVSKDIAPNDNVLEFVADKKGSFRIHCANNMGNSTLVVK